METISLKERMFRSLTNKDDGGFSARKLSALVVVILIIICHTKWLNSEFRSNGDFGLLPEILIIDFSFISIALGLTTMEQIIKLKNGKNETPTSSPAAGESPVI